MKEGFAILKSYKTTKPSRNKNMMREIRMMDLKRLQHWLKEGQTYRRRSGQASHTPEHFDLRSQIVSTRHLNSDLQIQIL